MARPWITVGGKSAHAFVTVPSPKDVDGLQTGRLMGALKGRVWNPPRRYRFRGRCVEGCSQIASSQLTRVTASPAGIISGGIESQQPLRQAVIPAGSAGIQVKGMFQVSAILGIWVPAVHAGTTGFFLTYNLMLRMERQSLL